MTLNLLRPPTFFADDPVTIDVLCAARAPSNRSELPVRTGRRGSFCRVVVALGFSLGLVSAPLHNDLVVFLVKVPKVLAGV